MTCAQVGTTPNNMMIALFVLCQLAFSALAWKNSRTNDENAVRFASTGELKSPKSIVVLFLVIGLFASAMALLVHRSEKMVDGTWPMALIGLSGPIAAWLRSFFGIRMEADAFCYGWRCHRRVAYVDIASMERRSDGRTGSYVLLLRSGAIAKIGSAISCETLLIQALQERTGQTMIYRRYGKITGEPESLVLQARYEAFKASLRK